MVLGVSVAREVLPELPHKVDFVVAAFNQDMMGKVRGGGVFWHI